MVFNEFLIRRQYDFLDKKYLEEIAMLELACCLHNEI